MPRETRTLLVEYLVVTEDEADAIQAAIEKAVDSLSVLIQCREIKRDLPPFWWEAPEDTP